MATSVRTKAAKKQLPFEGSFKTADAGHKLAKPESKTARDDFPAPGASLSRAVMELEDACLTVLVEQPESPSFEPETRNQCGTLKNIATPLSLALRECKGPRRFHYHYRHDPEDYDTLTPVAGPSPYVVLARLCEKTLDRLRDFHVVDDAELRREIAQLQHAAQDFLQAYRTN